MHSRKAPALLQGENVDYSSSIGLLTIFKQYQCAAKLADMIRLSD